MVDTEEEDTVVVVTAEDMVVTAADTAEDTTVDTAADTAVDMAVTVDTAADTAVTVDTAGMDTVEDMAVTDTNWYTNSLLLHKYT